MLNDEKIHALIVRPHEALEFFQKHAGEPSAILNPEWQSDQGSRFEAKMKDSSSIAIEVGQWRQPRGQRFSLASTNQRPKECFAATTPV